VTPTVTPADPHTAQPGALTTPGPRHHIPASAKRRIHSAAAGYLLTMARARTVSGYAIPGIIVLFFWMVVVILAIVLLAYIVHKAGGGVLNMRLGHFVLTIGFT
jgi:hypothetical protein